MNNYCGFVESWAGKYSFGNGIVYPYNFLETMINSTAQLQDFRTIAIFKIKLK